MLVQRAQLVAYGEQRLLRDRQVPRYRRAVPAGPVLLAAPARRVAKPAVTEDRGWVVLQCRHDLVASRCDGFLLQALRGLEENIEHEPLLVGHRGMRAWVARYRRGGCELGDQALADAAGNLHDFLREAPRAVRALRRRRRRPMPAHLTQAVEQVSALQRTQRDERLPRRIEILAEREIEGVRQHHGFGAGQLVRLRVHLRLDLLRRQSFGLHLFLPQCAERLEQCRALYPSQQIGILVEDGFQRRLAVEPGHDFELGRRLARPCTRWLFEHGMRHRRLLRPAGHGNERRLRRLDRGGERLHRICRGLVHRERRAGLGGIGHVIGPRRELVLDGEQRLLRAREVLRHWRAVAAGPVARNAAAPGRLAEAASGEHRGSVASAHAGGVGFGQRLARRPQKHGHPLPEHRSVRLSKRRLGASRARCHGGHGQLADQPYADVVMQRAVAALARRRGDDVLRQRPGAFDTGRTRRLAETHRANTVHEAGVEQHVKRRQCVSRGVRTHAKSAFERLREPRGLVLRQALVLRELHEPLAQCRALGARGKRVFVELQVDRHVVVVAKALVGLRLRRPGVAADRGRSRRRRDTEAMVIALVRIAHDGDAVLDRLRHLAERTGAAGREFDLGLGLGLGLGQVLLVAATERHRKAATVAEAVIFVAAWIDTAGRGEIAAAAEVNAESFGEVGERHVVPRAQRARVVAIELGVPAVHATARLMIGPFAAGHRAQRLEVVAEADDRNGIFAGTRLQPAHGMTIRMRFDPMHVEARATAGVDVGQRCFDRRLVRIEHPVEFGDLRMRLLEHGAAFLRFVGQLRLVVLVVAARGMLQQRDQQAVHARAAVRHGLDAAGGQPGAHGRGVDLALLFDERRLAALAFLSGPHGRPRHERRTRGDAMRAGAGRGLLRRYFRNPLHGMRGHPQRGVAHRGLRRQLGERAFVPRRIGQHFRRRRFAFRLARGLALGFRGALPMAAAAQIFHGIFDEGRAARIERRRALRARPRVALALFAAPLAERTEFVQHTASGQAPARRRGVAPAARLSTIGATRTAEASRNPVSYFHVPCSSTLSPADRRARDRTPAMRNEQPDTCAPCMR